MRRILHRLNRLLYLERFPGERGFTIIELLIATAVFSVIVTVLTFGIINISESYSRGIVENETQNTSRNIVNALTQAVDFNGALPTSPVAVGPSEPTHYWFCIGNEIFDYELGYQLNDAPNGTLTQMSDVLVEGQISGNCPTVDSPPSFSGLISAGGMELLSPNMRLTTLSVTAQSQGLVAISVKVVYGDDDLLCNLSLPGTDDCTTGTAIPSGTPLDFTDLNEPGTPGVECRAGAGQQFCATSDLETVVEPRISG